MQDGSYPLHYAAAFGQSHVVEALVEAGCPVDCKDDAQNTPLHLAAGRGHERLLAVRCDVLHNHTLFLQICMSEAVTASNLL